MARSYLGLSRRRQKVPWASRGWMGGCIRTAKVRHHPSITHPRPHPPLQHSPTWQPYNHDACIIHACHHQYTNPMPSHNANVRQAPSSSTTIMTVLTSPATTTQTCHHHTDSHHPPTVSPPPPPPTATTKAMTHQLMLTATTRWLQHWGWGDRRHANSTEAQWWGPQGE